MKPPQRLKVLELMLVLLCGCVGPSAEREELTVDGAWYSVTPTDARPTLMIETDQAEGRLAIVRYSGSKVPLAPLVDSGGAAMRWKDGSATSWAAGFDWGVRLSGPVNAEFELDVRHDMRVLIQRGDSTVIANVDVRGVSRAEKFVVEW